jgi:hypothetical protein
MQVPPPEVADAFSFIHFKTLATKKMIQKCEKNRGIASISSPIQRFLPSPPRTLWGISSVLFWLNFPGEWFSKK